MAYPNQYCSQPLPSQALAPLPCALASFLRRSRSIRKFSAYVAQLVCRSPCRSGVLRFEGKVMPHRTPLCPSWLCYLKPESSGVKRESELLVAISHDVFCNISTIPEGKEKEQVRETSGGNLAYISYNRRLLHQNEDERGEESPGRKTP